MKVGKTYEQRVPRATRLRTQANHSATHLLHWALRKVLGNHVKQAGSLVTPDLLRFDFTHFKAMSEEEKTEVETIINEKIALSEPLRTKLMSKDEAIAAGAMALFGEKYDDEVRVVSMGDGFSTELCGGTHVDNTSQIGCLVLVSEGGVAAGVRRIVAYTSMTAVDYLRGKASALDEIRGLLKAGNPDEAVAKVERLQTREKELDRKITAMQAESAGNLAKELVENARDIGGVKLVSHSLKEGGAEALKVLGERLKDRLTSGVIAIGAVDQAAGKAFIQVLVTSDLTKQFQAGKLVQAAAPLIEGKGGGKPEQAQAGGAKLDGLSAALESVAAALGAK
ncbi:MAG: hypothetical protein EOP11_07565 [Proteobacteria bacterium]|nr:MAG: hypothetical protein EOP11_07565 [Pseudomonadota bacterium]